MDGSVQQQTFDPARQFWEGKTLDDPTRGLGVTDRRFIAGDEWFFMIGEHAVRDNGGVQGDGSVHWAYHQYRPSTGRCDDIPTLEGPYKRDDPTGLLPCCAAFHDGCLYIQKYNHVCHYVKSFSVATGQWQALPRFLAEGLYDASACVVDGRLFVVGGCDEFEGPLSSVEEYISAERRWEYLPDMPTPIAMAVTVACEGKLLVVGGSGGGEMGREISRSRTVQEYDPVRRSWQWLPRMIRRRARCLAVVVDGDLKVMGGCQAGTVERYNRQSQCWEAMPSMPSALSQASAVVTRC